MAKEQDTTATGASLESPAILKGLSLAKGNTLKITLVIPNDPGVADFLAGQFEERIDITVKELPKASKDEDRQNTLFETLDEAEED